VASLDTLAGHGATAQNSDARAPGVPSAASMTMRTTGSVLLGRRNECEALDRLLDSVRAGERAPCRDVTNQGGSPSVVVEARLIDLVQRAF
jgi:hypothetical protein